MSTQTIQKNPADASAELSIGKESKLSPGFTSSLSMMTVSTNQLLESLGISPNATSGSEDSETLLLLEEEQQEVTSEDDKEYVFVSQMATGNASDGVKGTSSGPSGKDAIFESAADMSKVQSQASNEMIQRLEQQLQMAQTQLAELEKEAQFWQEFGQYWGKFLENPTDANLQKVLQLLEQYCPSDKSELEKWSSEANKANGKENQWQHWSRWKRFIHFKWSDPHYFRGFLHGIRGSLNNLVDQVEAGFGVTDTQFQNEMQTGQTLFQDHLNSILQQVSMLELLIEILEGGKSSGMSLIFQMEALLMNLEQMAVNNNTKKQEQQSNIAQTTINGLSHSLDKMMKEFKKTNEHHGGLFGWIEDFFKSIIKIFENMADIVGDVVQGDFKDAKKDFLDATGIETIIKAFQKGFKEGIESLFTAMILTTLFGPMGMAFMDTKFGKDMNDISKLVVDAVVALGDAIGAGIEKAEGNDKEVKKLLDNAKKLGEEMLANPALKALAQVAMIVIMIAAAVSGQVELAALMLVLFVMTETGLMNDLTKGLTDLFVDMGMSKDVAKVVADVLVIVIVAVLSFGAGSVAAAGDVAADEAASATEEIADEVTSNVTEEMTENTDTITSQTTEETANEGTGQSKNILQKIGEKVGTRGGMTLLGTGSALGSSTLGADIATLIADKDKKINKETLELILMIIQEVVAAVMAVVGGLGATANAVSSTESQVTQKLGKYMPKIVEFMEKNAASFAETGGKMMVAGNAVSSIASMLQAGDQFVIGEAQKAIAKLQGEADLFKSAQEQNNAAIQNTNEELKALMKEFDKIVNNMDAPSLAGQGITRALIQG